MRKVLFIAYLFPPIANSGTRRSLSFANRLPDHGWEPVVLTLQDPPARSCDETLLAEVRPGTRIERAPLLGSKIARGIAGKQSPGLRSRVAGALEWRLNSAVQVPDEVISWFPAAVKRGVELHKEIGFDAIYASGWPWTSFLVASAIGRKTGCPFVLDFRDTWTPRGTEKWEKPTRARALAGPWLERRAARNAAALITVTPTLVEAIRESTGRAKVHCITNGFEPDDFGREGEPPATDQFIRIAYTGIWREDYGLHGLYLAIRRLKEQGWTGLARLRVRAAGFKPGPAREMGVDDVVEELGYVPHATATGMMNSADLLYLSVPVGYYANACLPGKMFEYMGSASPILAVVPAESEVARVLAEVGGAVRTDPGDVEAVVRVVTALVDGNDPALFSPRDNEQLQRYTRASTTASLAAVLESVCAGAPTEPRP
jgi:glycosyltransferase involved in cell wall biosynthesis